MQHKRFITTEGAPPSICAATYDELTVSESVTCGPYIILSCPLSNSALIALRSTPAPPSSPQQLHNQAGPNLNNIQGCWYHVLAGETPQSTCTVTFGELAAAGNVTCGPYITLSCPLCNSTAATLQSTQSTPSTPQQPFCNSTVHLTASTGTLTDGSPSGADYAPGSFCQWLIDPGYRYVLADI